MRSTKRWWMFALILLLGLVAVSCTEDEETDPTLDDTLQNTLEAYWTANQNVTDSMNDLNDLLAQIEAEFSQRDTKDLNDDVEDLVNQYLAKSEETAALFDELIALENQIQPYGADKGMFTDAAKAVVVGVYNTAKGAVVSSGRMVRTGWRVLSGQKSLREALSAPDSGIPIVSQFAQRLQEHNAARDRSIVQSIQNGDSQEGNVPLDELEGSTPEDRANYYLNLPDDHPLKKEMRGNVHLWNTDEKTETVKTLKNAATDQIKNYTDAVSGTGLVGEIGEQMMTPGQEEADKGTMKPSIRDENGSTVAPTKTVIIHKQDQPEDAPKIAVVENVPADFEVELPEGSYDLIVIADDYIRSVKSEIDIWQNQLNTFVTEMYEFANHQLVIESVTINPENPFVGETVNASAVAASIVGSSLTFAWTVSGENSDLQQSGPSCSFIPTASGDYTVTVTATDVLGNTKSKSVDFQVSPIDVEITDYMIFSETLIDSKINPGETVTLQLTLANHFTEAVSGTFSVVGQDRIIVNTGAQSGISVPAGGQTMVSVMIQLPADFSEATGVLACEFAPDGQNYAIVQDVLLDVEFYVTIDPITSPVTNRILNVTGWVANPSLTSAYLIIDNDFDQLFLVNLYYGRFEKQIAVEASNEEVDHTIIVQANSGSWEASDSESFSSQVAPAGFRVTLTWDTNGTDVDLWTTDPTGERCYYAHPSTASGLMLDFDDTNGYGPENITNSNPPSGPYLVQVHYYSDHDGENAIFTNCAIIVRLNEGSEDEETRYFYGSLTDTGDLWTVVTINIGETGRYQIAEEGAKEQLPTSELPQK